MNRRIREMPDMSTHHHRHRSRRLVLGAGIALAMVWAMSYRPVDAVAETAAPAPAVATAQTAAALDAERATLLDISVRAFTPPQQGAVEAVVSLEEAKDGGKSVEVGRFTVFPAAPFEAKEPKDERVFRLDAGKALAALDASSPLRVKVKLEPLLPDRSPAGASLTLGKAVFASRETVR
jgi:hypothetical protein